MARSPYCRFCCCCWSRCCSLGPSSCFSITSCRSLACTTGARYDWCSCCYYDSISRSPVVGRRTYRARDPNSRKTKSEYLYTTSVNFAAREKTGRPPIPPTRPFSISAKHLLHDFFLFHSKFYNIITRTLKYLVQSVYRLSIRFFFTVVGHRCVSYIIYYRPVFPKCLIPS